MEQSISSLAFRGSIIEAITEAKRQKKLFVVYISGDNEDSVSMDKSTWPESNVAESLSKYCILLHLIEGSVDAAQFSALYPQKSSPSITAIGCNGVQLWQNEGFVSAEVLASTLEKEWLSLHVQETTATFLTAALASRQSEQISSQAPPTASREIGGSSSASSTNTNASTSVDKKDVVDDKEKSVSHVPIAEEIISKVDDDVSHVPVVDKLEANEAAQPVTTNEPAHQVTPTVSESGVDKKRKLDIGQDESKPEKSENSHATDNSDFVSKKSTDIYLNIRLPGGANLQEKFEPTCTLKMVKDYVDQKQESAIGSYDLAVPYPRRVFSDGDLSKTLTELSLFDRQALIVVPHLKGSGLNKVRSYVTNPSASTSSTSGSSNVESYFSLVKRYLSYVNPLAYLGAGDATAANPPETRRVLSEPGDRRSSFVTSNQSSNTPPSSNRSNKPSSSRFGSGSNIHTLKHDEDNDTKFSGKNAFWNGNSTEYGGDGDNK
ncbi:plant UBX domain-containing protein 11 [Rutidosis leptorrhynchoides]|uniref:plant UBX domain-containing protein 11 n=1 Tax=Rutidosis leptorrhynchoides TaxID=125765 RepID=UPI003A9A3104